MIIQKLPEYINYFQINKVFLDPTNLCLDLELVNPLKPLKQVKFKLCEISYFSISKTPEDNEGNYLIGEIQLSQWDDVDDLYKKINYSFSKTSVDHKLYYLNIEGDICLEVVSKSCVIELIGN